MSTGNPAGDPGPPGLEAPAKATYDLSTTVDISSSPTSDASKANSITSDNASPPKKDGADYEPDYPGPVRLTLITIGFSLAMLCTALDSTIMATAIPRITDDFHALNDVGWYAAVYLLMTCAFQLFFGKLYSLLGLRWVFLFALAVFELGSLICALSPSSVVLIVGRAISGLGAGGIFSGSNITVAYCVPMKRRPIFQSLIGGIWGLGSIIGPLVGGAFTSSVTWRWCFWINLPIGGVTALCYLFFYKASQPPPPSAKGKFDRFLQFDPLGTAIFLPATILLLVALQWGGSVYAWSNGRVIALLVLAGVLALAFLGVQAALPRTATLSLPLFRNRTVSGATFFAVAMCGSFVPVTYFLPIYFQAIRGVSALQSGVHILPYIIAEVLGSVAAGVGTVVGGYCAPFILLSTVFMSVGAGLLTTLKVDTPTAVWIGFQIVFGVGNGFGMETGIVATQSVLPADKAAQGVSIVLFAQLLSGAVFTAIGQNLFIARLSSGLAHVPGLSAADARAIIDGGATAVRSVVRDPDLLDAVLKEYNAGIMKVFLMVLITSCISGLGAVCIQWVSVKEKQPEPNKAEREKTTVDV